FHFGPIFSARRRTGVFHVGRRSRLLLQLARSCQKSGEKSCGARGGACCGGSGSRGGQAWSGGSEQRKRSERKEAGGGDARPEPGRLEEGRSRPQRQRRLPGKIWPHLKPMFASPTGFLSLKKKNKKKTP